MVIVKVNGQRYFYPVVLKILTSFIVKFEIELSVTSDLVYHDWVEEPRESSLN